MKRAGRKQRRSAADGVSVNFVRGFVATGLLAALQDGGRAGTMNASATLRSALHGGAALAAGSSAAGALQRRDYSRAVLAITGGAAAMVTIDYLTHQSTRSDKGGKQSGKEKA